MAGTPNMTLGKAYGCTQPALQWLNDPAGLAADRTPAASIALPIGPRIG